MIFYRDTLDFTADRPTVLTIGKFDGLHMGHKKLLDEVMKQKKERGLATAIFTFNMPPNRLINHETAKVLTTNEEKHMIFEEIGTDFFVECPFVEEIRNLEVEDFIKMMVEKLQVKCFVVGTDCHFAHNRSGDYHTLRAFADKYHYDVIVIEKKQYEGRDISSTFVREEIEAGNIEKANMLLGYPYFIQEVVVHGNAMGHTFGFPTINQVPPAEKLLPPRGVYAAKVIVDGVTYLGVTNIGVKPTIEGVNVCGVETNIFDFDQDIYGKSVRVQLLEFLRPEQKFADFNELIAQITRDAENAKRWAHTL